jgi:hypothetical protein
MSTVELTVNGLRWDVADAGQAGVPGVSGNANSQFVVASDDTVTIANLPPADA